MEEHLIIEQYILGALGCCHYPGNPAGTPGESQNHPVSPHTGHHQPVSNRMIMHLFEKLLTNTIAIVIVLFILIVIPFLLVSLVHWNFNPQYWHSCSRLLYAAWVCYVVYKTIVK